MGSTSLTGQAGTMSLACPSPQLDALPLQLG